jgi:hypothetical protein
MTSTWHSPGNTWLAKSLRTRCHWHRILTLHPLQIKGEEDEEEQDNEPPVNVEMMYSEV